MKTILVTCKDCKKQWQKNIASLSYWQGRCYGCEMKNRWKTNEYKEKLLPMLKKNQFKKGTQLWRGKHHTEKTKIKISLSKKGKPNLKLRGRGFSEEHKKNLSNALSGLLVGDKNPNWKGGISKMEDILRTCKKYKLWQTSIFKRDNWTCQTCGKRGGGDLNAHHSKKFNKILKENKITNFKQAMKLKELWNINNGVTLCKNCHRVIHKIK